jgi:Phage tail tube protein FII
MSDINVLPERIAGYRAYKDGNVLLGVVDVELPKISLQSETIKGAGILGEMETPTIGYTKALKLKINFRTTNLPMLGLLECVGHSLEFRSAVQKYDSAAGSRSYDKVRIVVRGFPSEGELEKLESNGANASSIELNLVYLKYIINDTTALEIDKINYKYVVNANDTLSEVRDALGLT